MNKLTPPEVPALVIACLMDVFKYADHQAVAFAESLIAATSDQSYHPTMNAVIHRGIDGHRQWKAVETDSPRTNIQDIFQRVGT